MKNPWKIGDKVVVLVFDSRPTGVVEQVYENLVYVRMVGVPSLLLILTPEQVDVDEESF